MNVLDPHARGRRSPFATPDAFFQGSQDVHFVQLRYDYSNATLLALKRDMELPERLQAAVPHRQIDFLAGRHCARDALGAAGLAAPASIAIGKHGAPQWPSGFTGSITHCQGLAIVAVAQLNRIASIGIDLEALMPAELAQSVCREIATSAELNSLRQQPLAFEVALTLLFSAKESIFKALYPSILRYFDFTDVEATALDLDTCTLEFRLRVSLSEQYPQGKFLYVAFGWHEGYVVTRCLQASANTSTASQTHCSLSER